MAFVTSVAVSATAATAALWSSPSPRHAAKTACAHRRRGRDPCGARSTRFTQRCATRVAQPYLHDKCDDLDDERQRRGGVARPFGGVRRPALTASSSPPPPSSSSPSSSSPSPSPSPSSQADGGANASNQPDTAATPPHSTSNGTNGRGDSASASEAGAATRDATADAAAAANGAASSPSSTALSMRNAQLVTDDHSMFESMRRRREAARSEPLTIVVIGASGDLAKKKTLPAIFSLFYHGLLPVDFQVIGFARSQMSDTEFRNSITGSLSCRVIDGPECARKMDVFMERCFYMSGKYDDPASFAKLDQYIRDEYEMPRTGKSSGDAATATNSSASSSAPPPPPPTPNEENSGGGTADAAGTTARAATNRMYYMAVPPTVFVDAARGIAQSYSKPARGRGWLRVVVEKPFGRDSNTYAKLQRELSEHITEDQVYRIDHYLGKELVQNCMTLRFANYLLEPLFNNLHVKSIQVTFKEDFGVEGRAGYFDSFGIVRDIMQNHLLQVLALFTMEPPVSLNAEDIRNEKVKLLRCLDPPTADDFVTGQYRGYLDEPGVPVASKTPTFAACRMRIRNRRWDGVPVLLKAGKALDERMAEVRITFKDVPGGIFPLPNTLSNNELVVRVQPDEAIYLRIVSKTPGLTSRLEEARLNLFYREAWEEAQDIPDAYERLILDVVHGEKSLFIRSDELKVAWDKFTPALKQMEENDEYRPVQYVYGSRGPAEADYLAARAGVMWGSEVEMWRGDEGGGGSTKSGANGGK